MVDPILLPQGKTNPLQAPKPSLHAIISLFVKFERFLNVKSFKWAC